MSPSVLKPLMLPVLVENRLEEEKRRMSEMTDFMPSDSDLSQSSMSTRGHVRQSSSSSSLEISFHLQDTPSSPLQPTKQSPQLPPSAIKPAKRSLPDVEEEPAEREEDVVASTNNFGLYSCLCDSPCDHRTSAGSIFPGDFIMDVDIDYDAGFMSDGDLGPDARLQNRRRTSSDAPFRGLTTRLGSQFSTINRWRSGRTPRLVSSPTTETTFENAMPYIPSSRSSSISASTQTRTRSYEYSTANTTPITSYFQHHEIVEVPDAEDCELDQEERKSLERERAMATTPLLPPLMTKPTNEPRPESPLQSPTVASSTAATEIQRSPTVSTYYPRPSLSTKPSLSSFRFGGSGTDLPLPYPSIMQDHDEWSDRLGHANFTITPQPYEPEAGASDTLGKFREDWDAARCNYTKHLVRTGENYGQTSKIYALTEAKWAETEKRWRSIHDVLVQQNMELHRSAPVSASNSRSRSRGRGRGRRRAGSATFIVRSTSDSESSPKAHWPRLDDAAPNAITQMLDASNKFPNRGDEDIVGPMHRDEVMIRSRSNSEERKSNRFWKSLVDKVSIRK